MTLPWVLGQKCARWGRLPQSMFAGRTSWNLAPNRFSAALERCRASGTRLLDLTESNPTRVGLEYPPQWLSALASPAALEYHPDPHGLPVAREAVAGYYQERGGGVPPLDRILLTSSTSEGYSFLFRLLCHPGDEVLVPVPTYPLFDLLASVQDVRLVHYPLLYDHGWQMDLRQLPLTPRSRALLVVNPNNPTGSFVKLQEREALVEVCRQRELAIIADEVFLDYEIGGAPRPGFVAETPALTFTLSGISKICALPQMKLSWLVVSGPEGLAHAAMERLEVIADTYLSVSAPVQLAAREFLSGRAAVQQQLRQRIAANLAELDRQLAAQRRCTRLDVEGGWYVVLRIPATGSDEDLAIALLEQAGVVVHPGHFYDFSDDGFLVVSLITLPEVFAQGMGKVLAMSNQQ